MQYRIPFIVAALVNLIAGIWSGLIRIGWTLPGSEWAVHHGAIMIGGFLTTLIALEKVISLKRKLAFIVPAISAISLIMVIPGFFQAGIYFLLMGSVGLLLIHSWYLYRYPGELPMLLMLVGAVCLVMGNVMLIDMKFYPAAIPWWMGFLLFTITAERLELSRFLPVSKIIRYWLISFLLLYIIGILLPFHVYGKILSGIALTLIAVWMMRFDMMRIGIRKTGLTKFSAISLLVANMWLLITGLLMFVSLESAFEYDMLVHSFFIGYTISMIFAHGPIILPGVMGYNFKPFHSILFVWLILLHGSLLLRIISDAWLLLELRAISGLLSVSAILIYFVSLAILVLIHIKNSRLSELSKS